MNKNNNIRILKIFFINFLFFIFVSKSFSNNLSISNIRLGERNPSANTVIVNFDVSWENSWKTKINHDAVWLTVRFNDPAVSPSNKKLCKMTTSGTNPDGTYIGSSSDLELFIPADKTGVFVKPAQYGVNQSLASEDVQLTVDYDSCGFDDNENVYATVLGIEMVYIPEGDFYTGDYDASTASLDQGSTDSDPWQITGESTISVTNASADGYRYVSGGNINEDATGTSFSLPSSFPKGYGAFYVMKYEITEEQWVAFVNSLPSASARVARDLTNGSHKNTDLVKYRNTLSCSGSPLTCTTDRPYRAVSYLTWMDLAAFLDWAALRPMTELEYEKMARGPLVPVPGEFVWGTTSITAPAALSSGEEDGTETVITPANANAQFNNVTLTGGDTGEGAAYAQGPLRTGIFATDSSTRESAGAGYYGVLDLSGNINERVVTIGNVMGRLFEGTNGDGILSTVSGYEGNANQDDWPGIDGVAERGVTGALGSGFKGGAWDDALSGIRLRTSDRQNAANADTAAYPSSGGRGVRSVEN